MPATVQPLTGQFAAFTELNTNQTAQPVPARTNGCYVTLIGAGGSGGAGSIGATTGTFNFGGAGGGGGGRIPRVFIPVSSLGATYNVTQGLGVVGANGGNTVFSSGSISLTARGGQKGADGNNTGNTPASSGGTCTLSGMSATNYTGAQGAGTGLSAGTSATACCGGGVGRSEQISPATGFAGTSAGGASTPAGNTVAGGLTAAAVGGPGLAPLSAQDPQLAGGAGGGGAGSSTTTMPVGGNGGNYGGGGGGSGGCVTGSPVYAKGGDGYVLVEWV